jgi:hypothetical protein
MKSLCLLTLWLASTVAAQTAITEKPCISFTPESNSATNMYAKEPLQAAVMLSGDFEFYTSGHEGCWNVHVLSLPVISGKGKRIGYAISHTVTDPKGMEVGHALTFGPDPDIFVKAMHKAAADAIRNIRHMRSIPRSHLVTGQSERPPD